MTGSQSGFAAEGVMFLDADGTASWHSPRVAAIAPVEIALGGGCVVTVDPADPRVLLSWTLDADADAGSLGRCVGNDRLTTMIEQARAAGTDHVVIAGQVLLDAWARYAAVAAARRWIMRPVNEAALLIDRAVAAFRVGAELEAAALFVAGEDLLVDLGERCRDGEMPTAVVALVHEALRAGMECGLAGQIEELAEDLDGHAAITDEDLARTLTSWRQITAVAEEVESDLGGHGEPAGAKEVVDIAMVPPRIMAWRGADSPELTIEYDCESEAFVVSTGLAVGVDPLCLEVRRLLVFAARRADGVLVATAPMRLRDGSLISRLPTMGNDRADLVFGILDAGVDPESLRTEPVARYLVEVDRTMVETWGRHRASLATLNMVPVDAGEELLRQAQNDYRADLFLARGAVGNVLDGLEEQLDELESDTEAADELASAVRARIEAVTHYGLMLQRDRNMDPILSELLPPDTRS